MAIHFTIERDGRTYRARADGAAPFFVGNQTSYTERSTGEEFEGLFNVPSSSLPKLIYSAAQARPIYDFWADFIAPTARCEGGNFLTLNTYDRARFTWGFGQFAAHVPDGDFVDFFQDMLSRPEAKEYFPNLHVKEGRIFKEVGDKLVQLESATTTGPLMDYLNPSSGSVEDAEVIAAAKLIHWTSEFEDARNLQAHHMVGASKRLMREADKRLGLDGIGADICCVICDIRHQGRAKYPAMQAALKSARPLAELLKLGSFSYPDRIKTLKSALAAASGQFNGVTWNRQLGNFK